MTKRKLVPKHKLTQGLLADGEGCYCAMGFILHDRGVPDSALTYRYSPKDVVEAHPEHVEACRPYIKRHRGEWANRAIITEIMSANDDLVSDLTDHGAERRLRTRLKKIGYELV